MTSLSILPVAGALSGLVVEVAVKATIVLLLTFAASLLLRRASAAARHLVWTAGLTAALLLPALTVGWPWQLEVDWLAPVVEAVRTPAEQASATVAPAEVGATAAAEPAVQGGAAATGAETTTAEAGRAAGSGGGLGWFAWLLPMLWTVGAVVVVLRAGWGLAALRRFRRRARRPGGRRITRTARETASRLGLERVAVRETGEVDVPLTIGVFRPTVLLPIGAADWHRDRLRSVLLHELAHVRRRDPLHNLLARAACAVHWYNPLVWLAAKRQRRESERACDDVVLRAGVRPSAYASHLLHVARAGLGQSMPALALSMARRTDFEGRLLDVLDAGRRRDAPGGRVAVGVAAVVVLSTVALASLAATPAASDAYASEDARSSTLSGVLAGLESADEPAVFEALVRLLDDSDREVRAAAARSLGDLGETAAVPYLLTALEDRKSSVRRHAAYALGQLSDERAVEPLTRRLDDDRDHDVRRAAAWALGEIRTDAAVTALATIVRERTRGRTRAWAIEALGESGHDAAVPVLAELVRDDDRRMQGDALEALAEIGTPSAVRVLVEAVQSDDSHVRRTAARALGGL